MRLKIKDMASVISITQALLLNGYEVQSSVIWKEFPQTGIDCFRISIFTPPTRERRWGVMKFVLNGCDISFTAEAPEDITLKQLLEQCDKINPYWCACGICSYKKLDYKDDVPAEIIIGYDSIRKGGDEVSCWIMDDEKGGAE